MIGLDTCAIIDLFKGDKGIKVFLERSNEQTVTTIINYSEIQFGLNPANSVHNKEREFYELLLSEIRILDLTREGCGKASSVFWQLNKKGKTIQKMDCTIAAILLTNGITHILTRNAKDFKHIDGLTTIPY
ncbi:MAG: type II toxin-antitoxin system VapC family toxin [Candidatus Woesearchaeota archaeon]